MIKVPININWEDYAFQYAVFVGDMSSGNRRYQYRVIENTDEIDPHPYHNIDYVHFISEDLKNLEKSDNSYYNIPIDNNLTVGSTYRYTSYNSDYTAIVESGTLTVSGVEPGYTRIDISGTEYIIHTTVMPDTMIALYDAGDDPTDINILIYGYADDYVKEYMPDNPNRTIEDGDAYIPIPEIKTRNIRFMVPWFKINNYKDTDYVLELSTWISGVKIVLGSYLITPEMYVSDKYTVYKESRYAEYVDLHIIDPWSLVYDDQWDEWRKTICGEGIIPGSEIDTGERLNTNNVGAILNISLTPISEVSGYYNTTPGACIGTYNTIITHPSDFMHLDVDIMKSIIGIAANIVYNQVYSNIYEYLDETYNIELSLDDSAQKYASVEYSLVITDGEEDTGIISKIKDHDGWDIWLNTLDPEKKAEEMAKGYAGSKWIESIEFDKSDLGISDWSEYKDGLFIHIGAEIIDNDEVVFAIVSDPIPLTPDMYKYLILTDLDDTPIELKNISMLNYIVHAVNKINKNVIQVENAKEYKSNMIRPVFFRANNINDIYLHPEVTENICLGLNAYKSKVDFFYVKVEGVIFSEIGRNHSGVIFKIQGNLLPHKVSEGTAYILDSNKELVTTGTFKYIS